ncbi:hypothetical protein [Paenibacillus sp. IHBB 10380]|uniref:hypothetical protein n=1 Tax=Paenibacillus sp. IHBB 10380 TaxID=1566358 RepID=UPI0005CFA02D|nr:hypothetical protein [Paenibacillus sp. IHBB 10380]AJS57855.1 hypothetical protein UB51_04380 [Paenibacillus sp. IHBB 10380]
MKKVRIKQGDDLLIVSDAYQLYTSRISANTDAFRAAVRNRNAQAVKDILGLPTPRISFFTSESGLRCVNIRLASNNTTGSLVICVPRR